jgi:hypothetical protein
MNTYEKMNSINKTATVEGDNYMKSGRQPATPMTSSSGSQCWRQSPHFQ